MGGILRSAVSIANYQKYAIAKGGLLRSNISIADYKMLVSVHRTHLKDCFGYSWP